MKSAIFIAMAAKMAIGEIVLRHRQAAGLSRRELAMFAGVGPTVIYELEHGKDTIRMDTLVKILDALNISIIYQSPLLEEMTDA